MPVDTNDVEHQPLITDSAPPSPTTTTTVEPCSGGHTPHAVLRLLTASSARRIAVALVLLFVTYHGILRLVFGADSCSWLLERGQLHGHDVWQPYGCMIHTYTHSDARRCLRYMRFLDEPVEVAFVGDSRVRELYRAFVGLCGAGAGAVPEAQPNLATHYDLEYADAELGLRVRFLWRPRVDAEFVGTLIDWRDSADQRGVPSLLVAASAAHAIKMANGSLDALAAYRHNVSRLGAVLQQLATDGTGRRHVLWAQQAPVFYDRLAENRRHITNHQLQLYNAAARQALSTATDVRLWDSHRLIGSALLSESRDGLHAGARTLRHSSQLLFNVICNDRMNFSDGTCCSSADWPRPLQLIAGAVLMVALLASLLLRIASWMRPDTHVLSCGRLVTLLHLLARLAIVMAYFFLCDRTNYFMKENRYFTALNFWLPLVYITVVGLFFTEESRYTTLLHRDQTDEWKGWMQLVILVYHMTYASQILPIYMHMRVLVSSYLFLTGYGHFMLFWNTGKLGLVRFTKVLFRMNMLTLLLCIIMNRPYQFYYFVPLVTFWYIALYITLIVPPRVTAQSSQLDPTQYLYLVLKLVVFFSAVIVLFTSEVLFERLFVAGPWRALFVTEDDDIGQWWFRCQLDRFSTGYGMVFAFCHVLARRHLLLSDSGGSNLVAGGRRAAAASLLALLALVAFSANTLLCGDKAQCNAVHPYLVIVPIVAYVVVRNTLGCLRARFSSLFAWFGRISLELFVGQYHIWLAANTHGVLVLVPLYPVLNVLITTFIFVCVSLEVHRITVELSAVCVPDDWRLCARNVIVFFGALFLFGLRD